MPVVRTLASILRFHMFAVTRGYKHADDCDALRTGPFSR